MLNKRQNLMETIKGGNPDRFVDQFEAFASQPGMFAIIWGDPVISQIPMRGIGETYVNSWGVTISWPEGTPGPFPVHDEEHKVLKDITKWKEVVKAPKLDFPDEEWEKFKAKIVPVDRNESFLTVMVAPGVFEQLHYLMGMDDCLINFYEEPELMHELIDYIVDWEVEYAKLLCKHYQPDCIFHHDDWGSYRSSFLSPEMFEEFFVPAYQKIYGCYKENGVELIVHHSDTYGANLVPSMIKMGIDIWQGCSSTNNLPELIKKYGGQISFMGDIDNGVVDKADWTPEWIAKEVRRACENNGKHYFIPNLTQGAPLSVFPGVYDAVSDAINKMSKEMF